MPQVGHHLSTFADLTRTLSVVHEDEILKILQVYFQVVGHLDQQFDLIRANFLNLQHLPQPEQGHPLNQTGKPSHPRQFNEHQPLRPLEDSIEPPCQCHKSNHTQHNPFEHLPLKTEVGPFNHHKCVDEEEDRSDGQH